ncbi:MAG: S-layer homology domain-containing protein [Oscillospiraceae bacterium]|nr:S-layer homology domain-containing protein [Oscillospiraceae bacterium]
MGIGFRIASLCLAFLCAAGLAPQPDLSGWNTSPPPITAPTPTPEPPAPQTPGTGLEDVSSADWFYEAVRTGVRHGYIRGGGSNRFYPQRAITRAEFVTMLGRMHIALGGRVVYDWGAGQRPAYTDVTPGAFYMPYLTWATELEFVHADAQQRFRPDAPLTREEMAVILVRYILLYEVYEHFDEDDWDEPARYADGDDISAWAYNEAHLLLMFDIMHGTARPGTNPVVYDFRPGADALRLEAAVVLANLFNMAFDTPEASLL